MGNILIGASVGFICSVGFLVLGYMIGVHTLAVDDTEEQDNFKNKVIDELVQKLEQMKEEV